VQVIVGFKKYRGQFPSFFIADWAEERCWRIANRKGGVVLVPDSGGLRTPAEMCRPLG
jgi:hypothetical protein